MGACTQCGVNADCAAATPVCVSALSLARPVRMCSVCLADSDCPSLAPHCTSNLGVASCAACIASAGCEVGVCSGGACVPECGPDKPCGNPLTECGANLRCEALSCTTSATCPANTGCDHGHCQRRSCDKDADCDRGGCVGSFCYDSLGTCFTLQVPS